MKRALATSCLAGTVVIAFAQPLARSVVPGLSLPGNQSIESNGPPALGFEFQTSRPIHVDARGVLDVDLPGSEGRYKLGIGNVQGPLLGSTLVHGLGDAVADHFEWSHLPSDLALSPRNSVVSATGDYGAGEGSVFAGTIGSLDGISVLGNILGNTLAKGGDFQFPFASTERPDPAWFGEDFSVKVPGPLPALGVAAGLGWSRRLRRRVAKGSNRPDRRQGTLRAS